MLPLLSPNISVGIEVLKLLFILKFIDCRDGALFRARTVHTGRQLTRQ
jgi:hypothetical protein